MSWSGLRHHVWHALAAAETEALTPRQTRALLNELWSLMLLGPREYHPRKVWNAAVKDWAKSRAQWSHLAPVQLANLQGVLSDRSADRLAIAVTTAKRVKP